MMRKILLLGALIASMPMAYADQKSDMAGIEKTIAKNFDGATADSISPSPVKGIYQAVFGTNVLYFSADGKHMFSGNLVDTATKANLTDKARGKLVLKALKQIPEDEMLIIGPKKPKHWVAVFTDVDCPYCAKFHKEVPELNKAGIEVRYLPYPRGSSRGPGYQALKQVWCADDKAKAMNIAKGVESGSLPSGDCSEGAMVDKGYDLGNQLGVDGTPALFTENGQKISGYVPAQQLIPMLLGQKPGGS